MLGERVPQAEVRHHRCDDGVTAELAAFVQVEGDDRQHLVAVDEVAALVDRDHAVGVAVERQARVGTRSHDGLLELGGVGRAAAGVDVRAVGLVVEHTHPRAPHTQGPWRDLERGAVPAVDHDRFPVEPAIAQRGRQVGDVVGGPADAVAHDAHAGPFGTVAGAGVDEPA